MRIMFWCNYCDCITKHFNSKITKEIVAADITEQMKG